MKKIFTLAAVVFCILTAFAQTVDGTLSSNNQTFPDRTPALEALFQESNALAETGTSAQIEANRLAIKNEWATIDPAIAALYTPINAPTYARLGQGPTPYVPTQIIERPDPLPMNRDWGDDILIRDDFVDGIDIEVTQNTGDIYVGMYDNDIDAGGTLDGIYIYRSTNDGASWSLFAEVTSPTPVRKMQLISLDGAGTNYILAYIMFEGGLMQVARWDMSNAAFDFQTVQTAVSDFSVDRNYPADTNAMRVLANYLYDDGGCATEVFSARSTTGSYGFDWVDEVSIDSVCGQQVDLAYARAGDAFVTYTGAASGNLYVNTNDGFHDPTSWTPRETVETGGVRETLNPKIQAARLAIGVDKVIIWASDRASGSGDKFDGIGYLRENGGAFAVFSNFSSGGANWNVAHTDGWVRKETGVETLRMSYVRDNISNAENDLNRSLTFNGTDFDTFEPVADGPTDVFDGFSSATAETSDTEPCLAFAGTNGTRGFGLYFDTRADLVFGVDENQIEGLVYYPNPTRETMTVSAANEITNITVYTILGQPVIQLTPNNNTVVMQTGALASGVFVMKVTSGAQTASFKIMKN